VVLTPQRLASSSRNLLRGRRSQTSPITGESTKEAAFGRKCTKLVRKCWAMTTSTLFVDIMGIR
jgi:hypothetical protein